MTGTGHTSFSLSSEERDHGSEGHTHEDGKKERGQSQKEGPVPLLTFCFFQVSIDFAHIYLLYLSMRKVIAASRTF